MNKLEVVKSKIADPENIDKILAVWHFQQKKIVFTNGCFDILHRGHIEYLAKAASKGDVLVIGLNTDSSVKRIKGPTRPVQDEQSRAAVLASLSFVDLVLLFDEDTPYELIKKIRPHILVKGADYKPSEIVGYDIVKESGGEVLTIEISEGYSTTSILNRLCNS
jgi:D-glycero-beta-D-manno-heptose 1-phosphate adenylyltransferase